MNLFEFSLPHFPLFPTTPLFPITPFDTWERDFFNFSDWDSHFVIPLNQCASDRLQKTSLKVHHCHLSWKGNVSFASYFNKSLDRLEREENDNFKRAEMLDQIKAARPVVAQAAATYDEIQAFEKELVTRRNDLRLKTRSPEVSNQLQLISSLLIEVRSLNLPKKLTKDSVEEYSKNARDVLEPCKKKFSELPSLPSEEPLRPDVAKANDNGVAVLDAPAQKEKAPLEKSSAEDTIDDAEDAELDARIEKGLEKLRAKQKKKLERKAAKLQEAEKLKSPILTTNESEKPKIESEAPAIEQPVSANPEKPVT